MAADADQSRASEVDKVQWLTEKCELEKEVAELRARIQAMEAAAATHEQAMAELRAQWADFQGAAETKVRKGLAAQACTAPHRIASPIN
jgi:predicted RNase H-like nuclease (RuvC/YqgF family)